MRSRKELHSATSVHGSTTYYGPSDREPRQGLRVKAIHTVIDSVLGHAIKTTVENVAAKHSGGATFVFFSCPNRRYWSLGVVGWRSLGSPWKEMRPAALKRIAPVAYHIITTVCGTWGGLLVLLKSSAYFQLAKGGLPPA